MSDQTPEKDAGQVPPDIEANVGSGRGADVGDGTDIGAGELDLEGDASGSGSGSGIGSGGGSSSHGDLPASSDPDAFVDDSTLGGTAGDNAGGAG